MRCFCFPRARELATFVRSFACLLVDECACVVIIGLLCLYRSSERANQSKRQRRARRFKLAANRARQSAVEQQQQPPVLASFIPPQFIERVCLRVRARRRRRRFSTRLTRLQIRSDGKASAAAQVVCLEQKIQSELEQQQQHFVCACRSRFALHQNQSSALCECERTSEQTSERTNE